MTALVRDAWAAGCTLLADPDVVLPFYDDQIETFAIRAADDRGASATAAAPEFLAFQVQMVSEMRSEFALFTHCQEGFGANGFS